MATVLPSPPRVGMVSLGCPKNLVDSERILTKLRSDGYQMSADYAGAQAGFPDSEYAAKGVRVAGRLDIPGIEGVLDRVGDATSNRRR